MIDFAAQAHRHYLDHLIPVWFALPPEERGVFYVTQDIAEHARMKGLEPAVYANKREIIAGMQRSRERNLTVVCGHAEPSWLDYTQRPNAIMMHGVGFTFDPKHSHVSYPGTKLFRSNTRLMLATNEEIAEIERESNPQIRVDVVGCPKLDFWHKRKHKPHKKPVIALAWHWRCKVSPDSDTLWDEYRDAIPELAKHYKLLGHGHPRIIDELIPQYEAFGVEVVRDLDEVFSRADLMVADATSAVFEFASLDRPVVPLFSRRYPERDFGGMLKLRRKLGVTCESPETLPDCVERALEEPEHVREVRREAVKACYTWTDGECSERAAKALIEVSRDNRAPEKKESMDRRQRIRQSARERMGIVSYREKVFGKKGAPGQAQAAPVKEIDPYISYLQGVVSGDYKGQDMPKVLQMLATYQTGGAQRVALSIAEATGSTVAYDSLDADGLSAFGCIAEKKNIPTVQLDYNAESVIEYMKREGFEVLHIHWCNWPKDSKFEQKKVLMAGFPVVITAHGRKPVPTVPGVALVSVAKGQAEGQANGSILIPNGFELAEFARVERDYSEVKRVGFASRLDGKLEPSMPSILSEAVADKGIELVVIGGGVHKDKFEGQAKRTGRKFAFEGMRGDMPEALSCLDLFVYPTQHDVSPTVVIEAMASGLPVVAPPVGDLPQMLADGRGFCVPFAQMRETVERLLVDETLRRETGERARAYALSTYPAEKMAESYTRLYGKLAELHRQRDEKQEVSIIIPTYRRPQLAYRAAVAALAQDIPVEVIVVNDGDLVSDYSCVKSLPVHFVQLKENSGLSGARNAGMQAARGEYVGFCDDDDLWTPQFARMLKSTLKRSKASIGAYGRGYETLPGGAKKAIYTQRFDSKLLLKRNYIQPSATMFRREELLGLGGFDEAMHRGGMHGPEDWELWLRLTSKGLKMTLCECGGLVYGGNTPNRLTNTAITTGAMNRGYDYIESKLGVKLGIRRH